MSATTQSYSFAHACAIIRNEAKIRENSLCGAGSKTTLNYKSTLASAMTLNCLTAHAFSNVREVAILMVAIVLGRRSDMILKYQLKIIDQRVREDARLFSLA